MRGNFSFLNRKWPELSELAKIAEENLYEDSNTTMIKLRMFGVNRHNKKDKFCRLK